MNANTCPNPLIEHRIVLQPRPGSIPTERNIVKTECPDPDCDGEARDHETTLPCRWSWPYARGRKFEGPFPKKRCSNCAHIRRAGRPHDEVAVSG